MSFELFRQDRENLIGISLIMIGLNLIILYNRRLFVLLCIHRGGETLAVIDVQIDLDLVAGLDLVAHLVVWQKHITLESDVHERTDLRHILYEHLRDIADLHERLSGRRNQTVTRILVHKHGELIADLPCSGLGILGKKPDIRFNARREGIRELQKLQREILDTVCTYVKPGGKLLYSTCTLTKEENEDNREYILAKGGFTLLKERKFLPGAPSDGFYLTVFRKE